MRSVNLKLKKSLNDVFFIEPNNLGTDFLTSIFKRVTHPLKNMPFILVVPLAFLLAIFMYFVFGYLLVRLVSFLQYGF